MSDLPNRKKYSVIYADPLLDFRKRNLDVMSGFDITSFAELKDLKIDSIAKKDSVLLMWIEGAYFERALVLIKAWGFTYRRVSFILHNPDNLKTSPRFCLLATKGQPKTTKVNSLCQVFNSNEVNEVGVGDMIKSYYPKASAIKLLFEKDKVKGWGSWGTWEAK